MRRVLTVYYAVYAVLLVVMLWLLCVYPKAELHLMLNAHHTEGQDCFFRYYSLLAEWPLYVVALLPLLLKRPRMTSFYALCELAAGAVVQVLKHMFSTPRPISYFEQYPDVVLPLVEGVRVHHSASFPSGHTSTFFVFATCCAILLTYHYTQRMSQNERRQWPLLYTAVLALLSLAALGGYSRIYLSQHFLADVAMGSVIGVLTPCVIFWLCRDKLLKFE